ncbi:histidine phosphatase family protein [Streptomyces sp. cf386]|uniref:histidine phosphatase family protein n=1 Tax=Streptomyces sp. cf386 TaxID=1761904 RepID=UPI00210A57F1|nr:histidine phosphatase family protein [Streptomyces sp. cf386]
MLCATSAAVSDDPVFGDGALTGRGRREDTATEAVLPPYSLALRAPSARCARAAAALSIAATPENALRDLDYGSWYGRPRKAIMAEDPYGFSAWLTDPDAAPHGGESIARLCRRTAAWLSSLSADTERILTITEAAIIRASLVHVLSAPAHAFWHLSVPPLSAVTLTMRNGCWNARTGCMAIPQQQQSADSSASSVAPLLVRP